MGSQLRFLILFVLVALIAPLASSAPHTKYVPKHKTLEHYAVATVAATPKISFAAIRQIVGRALWASEPVVDVAHDAFIGLDKATSPILVKKTNVFHYAAIGAGYADEYWERAEDYVLGSHN